MSPALTAREALRSSLPLLLLLPTVGLLGCPKNSSGGGITVPQSDGTAPELSLGAGQQQPNSTTYGVTAGGSPKTMTLTSKTGFLNLAATAKDQESGVQAVEIWMNRKTTTCMAGTCTAPGPGLLSTPTYQSISPKKNPGETTSESSILLEALDLSTAIPQGGVLPGISRTVELIFFARARNNLSGQSQTPELTATWKEP
jgi:hypothetical protein